MDINVNKASEEGNTIIFDVNVDQRAYKVSVNKDYHQVLTRGDITPEDLVKESFKFLLDREGPESILPQFDLKEISRYFPEYEETIKRQFDS